MLLEAKFSAISPIVLAAIWTGMAFCSLKMARFLASHNYQHKFFGIVAQIRLRMGLLHREPGKRDAQSLRSCEALSRISLFRALGRMSFHAILETSHWRKRWLEVSSAELHKAQRDGPRMPLFLKFPAVKSLSCRRSHMNTLTLGMLSGCQTIFQNFSAIVFSLDIIL